jgi:hypothetical protein
MAFNESDFRDTIKGFKRDNLIELQDTIIAVANKETRPEQKTLYETKVRIIDEVLRKKERGYVR